MNYFVMARKYPIRLAVIIVMALFFNHSVCAQKVFSEWISGTGTKGWDIVNDMTCDGQGNIYITGSSSDTVKKAGSYRNTSGISPIMYVAKFDTAGILVWKKNIMNHGSGYGNLLTNGKKDELIIAGSESISNRKSKNLYEKNSFFISSISTKGTTNWNKTLTGSILDYLTSVAVDTTGEEILLTGYFQDTLSIEKTIITSKGLSDAVCLRFDLNGNFKHVTVIGGKGEDKINCITTDCQGNRYLAGTFQQKIQFGNKKTFEIKNHRERGLFLAKYDYPGDIVQARQIATGKQIRMHSMTNIGNFIALALSFSDNITVGDKTLSARGSDDIILICLDQNLQIKWYKQIGGPQKDRASRVISNNGDIILSGSFNSSINIEDQNLKAKGIGSDIFIAGFDISGHLKWIRRAGGEADDYPTSLVGSTNGYIYVSGSYREKFNINENELQSAGNEDVFICRLENCNLLSPEFQRPESFCEGSVLDLDAGEGFIYYDWAEGLSHERTFNIDRTGEYSLQLIARNGCILYDTIDVLENAKPEINLGNDTAIADTSRILLHAGGNNSHYLWNNGTIKSENLIKGTELQEGPNTVTVTVTNNKGCTNEDAVIISMIRTMPNQISELVSGSCVLFPNPTSGLLTVYFTISFKSVVLTLYDDMGKELFSRSVSDYFQNSPLQFCLGSLASGLYTMEIKSDRGITTKKIILQ
jgi:hypothetical protein